MCPRHADARRQLDDIICRLRPSKYAWTWYAYNDLVTKVRCCSTMLSPASWMSGNWHALEDLVLGLRAIADHQDHYCRNLFYWNPPATRSLRLQFRSLLAHLLARYPVPVFLTNAWLREDEFHHRDRQLFLDIANGKSLNDCALPFQLDKPTRRWLMKAPDDLSVNQALRWAQIRSVNGDDRLARVLLKEIPVLVGEQDNFWLHVIRFFARVDQPEHGGPLCQEEIRQIIRFVHNHRFRPAAYVLGYRVDDESPLQPDLDLSNRTLRNVRRWMVNWREQLSEEIVRRSASANPAIIQWRPSGIRWLRIYQQGNCYTISELLTPRELVIEGAIMRHCVGGNEYVHACSKRKTTIWSLRKATPRTNKRLVTIEVDPLQREILQASAKCNEVPNEQSLRIIRTWAERENLTCEYLC